LIKSFEANVLKKRSFFVRLADALTSSFGTFGFLIFNVLFIGGWIIINLEKTPLEPFDPFPFLLLSVSVSTYAILLSIVVLISQNRKEQVDSLRQELQLQVNLISEHEITKALKMLKELLEETKKSKIKDEVLDEMIKEVDTSYIERKIQEQIASSENPLSPLEKLLKK
jgi:uncharacterized membrane protein